MIFWWDLPIHMWPILNPSTSCREVWNGENRGERFTFVFWRFPFFCRLCMLMSQRSISVLQKTRLACVKAYILALRFKKSAGIFCGRVSLPTWETGKKKNMTIRGVVFIVGHQSAVGLLWQGYFVWQLGYTRFAMKQWTKRHGLQRSWIVDLLPPQ